MAVLPGLHTSISLETAAFIAGTQRATAAMDNMATRTAISQRQMQSQLDRTSRSMRQFRANIVQVGYQIQDVAIQLQSGTAALTILAQQGGQVASVFGPLGAIIGTVISVAAAGASAWFAYASGTKNATEATDQFAKTQKALNELLKDSQKGILDQASAITQLSGVRRELAVSGIKSALENENRAIAANTEALNASFGELQKQLTAIPSQIGVMQEALRQAEAAGSPVIKQLRARLTELEAELAPTRDAFAAIVDVIERARDSGALEDYAAKITDLVRQMDDPNLAEFVDKILEQAAALEVARDKAAALREALGPTDPEAELRLRQRQPDFVTTFVDVENQQRIERERAKAASDAARAAEEAARAAEREQETIRKAAEARAESISAIETEVDQLQRLDAANRVSAAQYDQMAVVIDVENTLRKIGIGLSDEEAEKLSELVRERDKLQASIKATNQARTDEATRQREQQAALERQAAETERLLNQPFENFLQSVQSSTADAFDTIYSGGVKSFSDLFDTLKQLATRFAAELSALLIFNPQTVLGASGILGGSGGAGPLSLSQPITGVAAGQQIGGGVGLSSLLGAAGLGGLFGAGVGGAFGGQGTIGGGLGGAGGAAAGLAITGGNPLGATIGGLLGSLGGGFLGSLFGGGEKRARFSGSGGLGQVSGGEIGSFIRSIDQGIQDILNTRQQAVVDAALRASSVSVRAKDFDQNVQAFAASQRVGVAAQALGFNANAITGNGQAAAQTQLQNLQTALELQRTIEDLTHSVTTFDRQSQDLADQFADITAKAKQFGDLDRGPGRGTDQGGGRPAEATGRADRSTARSYPGAQGSAHGAEGAAHLHEPQPGGAVPVRAAGLRAHRRRGAGR